MTVKIYSLPSDAMSPPVAEGFVTDFVLASDYADLQRKVEALAGEKSRLQSSEETEILQKICNIFRIGIQAQTQSTILANVENAVRFADQLHAIEREFFMVSGEPDEDYPDDEPADVCLMNCWGSSTEQYVEQFREALAGIRVQARAEGINFAASRLAAAFNHGFVEKPMSEVFDVTKMILDTKAVLVNDQNIPSDGLSGEYAELALKQWEEQLRKESGQ